MRKRFIALTLLTLSLAAVLGFAQVDRAQAQQPVDDLTTLARYAPADTPFFATIRTDDGYIETLNGLLNQVNGNLGNQLPEGVQIPTVPELIDIALFQGAGSSLGIDLSWIGDTAAISLSDLTAEQPSALIMFQTDDPAGAEQFLNQGAAFGGEEPVEVDGTMIYPLQGAYGAVGEDAVFFSDTQAAVEGALGVETPLAESDAFTGALGTLPEDAYNIAAYLDLTSVLDTVTQMAVQETPGLDAEAFSQMAMTDASSGKLAIGAVIKDGRSLVLDVGFLPDDSEAFVNQPGFFVETPVNPDFAANLPADTQLLIHDHDMRGDYEAGIEALNEIGPIIQQSFQLGIEMAQQGMQDMNGMTAPQEEQVMQFLQGLDLSTVNFGAALNSLVEDVVAGLSGLDYTDDVLAFQTGDYALAASLVDLESDLDFSFEVFSTSEIDDPEAAANVIDALGEAASMYNLGAGIEPIADGSAIVYPNFIRSFFPDDFPAELLENEPTLDFMVAADDSVLSIGSRPGVTFTLNPEGGSLADNPVFSYASSLFLEDAYNVLYASTTDIANALGALEGVAPAEDIRALQFLVAQVESLTITSTVQEDGQSAMRLTLTVPESVDFEAPEGLFSGMEAGEAVEPLMPAEPEATEEANTEDES